MKRREFLVNSAMATAGLSISPAIGKAGMVDRPDAKNYPFLWGSAYYRAPIPEPELWDGDFKKMQELGFNNVKFLMQWRWSHIAEDKYDFEDFKQLLTIAEKYGINITINNLFDVSPHWLFEKYPDARQVMNNGRIIEPFAVGHRHIGGHPGPCYSHPGARKERQKFLIEAVKTLKPYKAVNMWDVWNEPELSFPQRSPIDTEKLVCYCKYCEADFRIYLQKKYQDLKSLNYVWGRNYPEWKYVEMPRSHSTFVDFIDWREFHSAVMTDEAKWRMEIVRANDPSKIVFLHVVPNTMIPFNAVSTCTDDFEVAKLGDVFAATMNAGPLFTPQVISAGVGKICYNVENHINGGGISMHQRKIDLAALQRDIIPQLGLGIKGIVFWQYRSEILGNESPAWGLVNTDGTDREVTRGIRTFWKQLSPHTNLLMKSFPDAPPVGIWKSRKNEIFHYCMYGNLTNLFDNVFGYANTCYWNSYGYRYVSGDMLSAGDLAGIKLLILPSAYYLTNEEAKSIIDWVNRGGTLLTEAHTGGYNGSTGRHSRYMPGLGLAEAFGIKEDFTTASFHLQMDKSEALSSAGPMNAETKKLLESTGVTGGKFYPIQLKDGTVLWSALRYAEISGTGFTVEGYFEKDHPVAISKPVGKGYVHYYSGSLGIGASKENSGLAKLLTRICDKAGIRKTLQLNSPEINAVRVDELKNGGKTEFITVQNAMDKSVTVNLNSPGDFKGLYSETILKSGSGVKLQVPPRFADIFIRK
ncbi:beta-galactosidase [Pollutibacter soli]|uniref:beta-galactosidase n=1 Tax=Pollutibacter soli TaxID=3034157 RepID=UPI00301330E5